MSNSLYTAEHKKLIDKLKEVRVELGLTQAQVSKLLKKPQSYVSKIERGERRIEAIELGKLANIYKKNISFFLK
jgi:transcriptional regulator with XRE-family HTH domain